MWDHEQHYRKVNNQKRSGYVCPESLESHWVPRDASIEPTTDGQYAVICHHIATSVFIGNHQACTSFLDSEIASSHAEEGVFDAVQNRFSTGQVPRQTLRSLFPGKPLGKKLRRAVYC
jgi:hypothetical protein